MVIKNAQEHWFDVHREKDQKMRIPKLRLAAFTVICHKIRDLLQKKVHGLI